jgi:hypothetical protein
MTTTYVTTVNNMFTIPNPTGYVVNVVFTTVGTDGAYTASIDGSCQFTPVVGNTIVPYASLTEAEVINWINQATNNQVNYYACINGQIESLINPPVSPENTPLPWAKT